MRKISLLGLVACLGAASAWATPKTYVLNVKGSVQQSQLDAIRNAGGSVAFQHDAAGLIMASSEAADFASKVKASGGFNSVTEDVVVQWTPPVRTVDFEDAAIDPSNDTLWPIQWAPSAIGAPAAWAAGCTGQGARVAVIDGGIYSAHPDLAANIDVAASASFVAGQPFNNDTGTFWHGTHVAGIIAAVDNATGVVGIAPQATIIGVKALHNGSGSFGAVISAILYAATPQADDGAGADIINMSLGAEFAKNEQGAGPLVAALNKAVNYAARSGVLVVSAAGNSGLDLDHTANITAVPAQSGSGLAIAATAPLGWAYGNTDFSRLASYSNYGTSAIHVSAPGGDFAWPTNENCTVSGLTRPCWVFDLVLSTSRAGYTWAAGTSMAAPAASAVAALIKAKHPEMSLGALKSAIAQSADDVYKPGADPYSGKGWVNAASACQQ